MNAPIMQPGIYADIPFDVYLRYPAPAPSLSSGGAHTILSQSPAHCWAEHPRNPKRIPGDESTDMDIGSVAHELLLEQSEARAAVIDPADFAGPRGGIPKGWTTDAIRAARDEARNAGKIPILLKDMQRVRAMIEVANEFIARSEIADVFANGEPEATVIACEGDIWVRARPDWITHDRSFAVHFKTTPGTAEPNNFTRGRMFSLGYDTALAFYERAIIAATGKPVKSCILVQETKPPYACSLVGLDPVLMDLAERKVAMAIRIWDRCIKTNSWPCYPAQICYAEPKAWQIAEVEEREMVSGYDAAQEEHGLQV